MNSSVPFGRCLDEQALLLYTLGNHVGNCVQADRFFGTRLTICDLGLTILETFRARSPRDTRRAVVFSDVAGLSPDDSAEAQLRHDSNLPIDPASTLVAFPPDSAPWAARGRAAVSEVLRQGAWHAHM